MYLSRWRWRTRGWKTCTLRTLDLRELSLADLHCFLIPSNQEARNPPLGDHDFDKILNLGFQSLPSVERNNLAGERDRHLFQPSALVNEAVVRLIGGAPVEWDSRTHFFAVSARSNAADSHRFRARPGSAASPGGVFLPIR